MRLTLIGLQREICNKDGKIYVNTAGIVLASENNQDLST